MNAEWSNRAAGVGCRGRGNRGHTAELVASATKILLHRRGFWPKWERVRCARPRSSLLISWATGSRPHPAPRLRSADALLDMHDMREPATVNAKSTTQLCDM